MNIIIAINDRHLPKHLLIYVPVFVILYVYLQAVVPFILNKIVLEKVFGIIKIHEIPLSIQRNKLIKKDIYGNKSEAEWEKEKKYFIQRTIYKELTKKEKEASEFEFEQRLEVLFRFFGYVNPYLKTLQNIDKVSLEKNKHFELDLKFYENMTGEDYELLCKEILTKSGWHVETTKRVGDQGVDLIAIKNELRVAIQCKRYSNNIGNSAVQEIISGTILYKANYGVVVSNVSYTKSAIELANAANIRLLHHYHLSNDNFYA